MGTFPDIDVLRTALKAKTAPATACFPKKQLPSNKNSILQN
jgi:hypothetical protein